jgi:arsenite methyltransferase
LINELEYWSNWLLQKRLSGPHGKDTLDFLSAVRDRVLDRAQLRPGDYVLDVGSGEGLLAFGAAHRVGTNGLVVVVDIAQSCLDACLQVATEAGIADRMRFILNCATDLCDVPDASIDAVLTRSVLLYVEAKSAAAAEFRRVLRPGGRLSIFEPVGHAVLDHRLGIDTGPIAGLAERVDAAVQALQSSEAGSLTDFDERDLLKVLGDAGFSCLDMELHVKIRRGRKDARWFDALLDGNAYVRIPHLREAISQALTPKEAETYVDFYRNAVATTGVTMRQAFAYICGSIGS